jgi:hypothetical protein
MRFEVDLKIIVNDETVSLKHCLDCSKGELAEELYKWCKDYETNVAKCETVIKSLLVNGEEDYKEKVLQLEIEHFLNFPGDIIPHKKPLP